MAVLCVYGGAPYPPQIDKLRAGVDIVVGTPGRVKDHLEKMTLDLATRCTFAVLDEADAMLDMGFQVSSSTTTAKVTTATATTKAKARTTTTAATTTAAATTA